MNEFVFALDIGTRSVTGIILEKQQDLFKLVDYEMREHKARSMHDGQIHNVVDVAEVILQVKEALEEKHGPLHHVCVAAAGRSLKTIQASATIQLNQRPITSDEKIKHLELSAVQAGQLQLAGQAANHDYANYYCVGYSVLYYKLDDNRIGSLIDQRGDSASVEVIATFLPRVVVESLFAALGRANLEMEALTLEPIAAIDVLIPESMRRLNVALVDIGAGTSDIAITDKGTVVAYGMVPVAGDEITEAISDQYLLDFPTAEQTKRNIVQNGSAIVSDILGFETEITYDTLVISIKDRVDKLATSIANEIMQLNAKVPQAVMLVGGASLTPNLTTTLANQLNLPPNRVAVRGIEAVQQLAKTEKLPAGPEFVTPIGIAIAAKKNPVHYVTVNVNEAMIRLFELKKLTIGDSLIQAGIEINKYYGRPGIALFIELNGQEITLPGEYGQAPIILLNDKPATVDSPIHSGDQITIEKGKEGNRPQITIGELFEEIPSFTIYFNDKPFELETKIIVNHKVQAKNYLVQDNDIIQIQETKSIQDFLSSIRSEALTANQPFTIYVNNKQMDLDSGETQLMLNGKKTAINSILKQNDRLTITYATEPTVKDMLQQLEKEYWHTITVRFNGKPVTLRQPQLRVERNKNELDEATLLRQNDRLNVVEKETTPFIFQDVFRYVDLDLTNANGNFKLQKNDLQTGFDDLIQHGDFLSIEWE